jgi:glycosyltransferase involved in cell wall biosynthesis
MTAVPSSPHISLVLEQTLGHRTHTLNIEQGLRAGAAWSHSVHQIDFGRWGRVPWAVAGSMKALRAVATERAAVTFFHTQSVALLAPLATRGRPYVVSVDATPVQVDSMGRWYDHETGWRLAERGKHAWYSRVFGGASAIVTWSHWARRSIERDYGVHDTPIEVIHPGAPASFFDIERCAAPDRKPTVLFVGGDFVRKGGPQLIEAFAPLRDRAELVLMTDAEIDAPSWARVLRGVRAGSPEHRRAFAEADIFCLPTLGDCTPLVVGEAMAAGLPVVTTDVGSNAESLGGGEAGLLVPPGDATALRDALCRLITVPQLTLTMGEAARDRAREHMDAAHNVDRLMALLLRVAAEREP